MKNTTSGSRRGTCRLLGLMAICMPCAGASAAVTLLGVQYQQDNPYTEYQCLWHDGNYPTSCGPVVTGSNVHAYLKNTGTSSVTINDVTLAGYSLTTVIKRSSTYHDANSIYFYWDSPPQAILDAGEPVWFKADPETIPAGGVGQVVVRLRSVPVTQPVSLGIVTSAGTVTATIPVNASAPQLASVGFSADKTKVYLHWRRSGGAAPASVWMDGSNVTASTTTVGDASVNFAESVLSLGTALANGSYHVYQGVYSDGKTATASLRTWSHEFIHASWYTFDIDDSDTVGAQNWIDDCTNRGVNAVENQMSGGLTHFLQTSSGRAYADAHGYGVIAWQAPVAYTPLMWFLDDEPDGEEDTLACGTGLKLPCGSGHDTGVLVMRNLDLADTFKQYNANIPITVNMDGTLKPDNYYSYGQAVDCLQVDPYYQARLRDTHYDFPERWPLYSKATYIYAVSQAVKTAAEPNPSHVILFSTRSTNPSELWPFPTRESKRIEFYYALAGGAKGISYWWFKGSEGLGVQTPDALALWDEIGLLGNEAKTISPQLVTSHPIDMTLTPGANVWARALACGTDTMILLAVNDNYYNDISGCHYTPVAGASVVATLPSWMTASPTAFEVRPSGLFDVSTSLNGNNLTVNLGTLNLTRLIVITTNSTLRATVQQRYQDLVWPGVCAFAPSYCLPQNNPPTITQHPSNQTVALGGSTAFTVGAAGSSPLSYQWQKNTANLSNGGHYSGCTTATLTVSSADANDAANYRCVVTNPYGTATSNAAALSLGAPAAASITQQPSNQSVIPGGTAAFVVTATGSAPLAYQWQKNQANLSNGGHYSGATTATLTISGADSNDSANYRCVVTNGYGSDTSNEAALTVTACTPAVLQNGNFEGGNTSGIAANWTGYTRTEVPSTVVYTIQTASPAEGLQYQQIQTSYVASGGAGVYQVVTGCTIGFTYTISGWMRTNSANGRATVKCAPNGSTNYSSAIDLAPAATTTSSSWGTFSGTVTATASSMTLFLDCQTHVSGSTAKAAAFDGLTVTGCSAPPVPTITQHPLAQSICPGTNTSFTVAASGSGTLTYQWQKNSSNLSNSGHYSGVTTTTLTVSSADVNDGAAYRCVVSNAGGGSNSNAANLTLKTATAVNLQPVSQSVPVGGTVNFTVTASGDGALTYQWQKDTVDVADGGHYSGTTLPTLTITDADGNDIAGYRCVVSGGCGSATSNPAALTLGPVSIPGDFDQDQDVDQVDFAHLQNCFDPLAGPVLDPTCANANLDNDAVGHIDQTDLGVFLQCMTGPGVAGNPNCAN